MADLPLLAEVEQTFPRPQVSDVVAAVREELGKLPLSQAVLAGQKIGITAGSRGIKNISVILHTVVDYVRSLGAEPYLLAAMGSHGGGTEQGQREVLTSLGLTEQAVGAPVLTCRESTVIGRTNEGIPAYVLQSALKMGGIIVVNRIKPHTSFHGTVESGLVKKLVVGLGGPQGAKQFHNFGSGELPRLLVAIGQVILQHLPILGGLGIVENGYEETAKICAVAKDDFITREAELLDYAKSLMPALPVADLDLLLIKEMGKNYSGTGVDTNIIGRMRIEGVEEPAKPVIKRIAVFDLSEASHGNATGLGLVDFVTQRVVDKMDRPATYLNCLTSTFVVRAAIPMYFATDQDVVQAALRSLGDVPTERLRVVAIPNTLYLTHILLSPAVMAEVQNYSSIRGRSEAHPMSFDAAGNLIWPF